MFKNIYKKIILTGFIALSCLSVNAFAENTNIYAKQDQAMMEKLKKSFPNLEVRGVNYLPDVHLYEIQLNKNFLSYTNQNVDFFFMNGQIINPKSKKDISKERDRANVERFINSLPSQDAIKVVFGKPLRKIAIFTDPRCPYCKATDEDIHANFNKDSNIEIDYYMDPLRIKGHEDSPEIAAKIWCSPNKSKAWVDWMLNGVMPNNDGSCKNPIAKLKALAEKNNLDETPIIMFDNGYIWSGQSSAAQIKAILNKTPIVPISPTQ